VTELSANGKRFITSISKADVHQEAVGKVKKVTNKIKYKSKS
jgi:hypothetical protein